MNMQQTEHKLTDELERRLIQREIDSGTHRSPDETSVFMLEIVVGTLLVVGMLLLAALVG
ncbi:MAG: hypothetical protein ABJA83_16020 [Burkholderiaceae bacterium]